MAYPNETNGLGNPLTYHEEVTQRIQKNVPWTEPGLKITRLRLLTDSGFPAWDVSYCHGELNGEPVGVELPFHQLPKRGIRAAIIQHAKAEGLYVKETGIFDCISQLW